MANPVLNTYVPNSSTIDSLVTVERVDNERVRIRANKASDNSRAVTIVLSNQQFDALNAPPIIPTPTPTPTPPVELGRLLPPRLKRPSGGQVFVVDAGAGNASDSNIGTESLPWKTISKALTTLTAGQTCLVKNFPGQKAADSQSIGYRPTSGGDHVIARAGTLSAPIYLAAFPGHKPIILPGLSAPTRCLRMTTGAAFWIVEGFELPYALGSGNDPCIYGAGDSHDIEVSRCDIHHAHTGGGFFVGYTSKNWHIIGNECHHHNDDVIGNQSHGIYVQADGSVILNNVVRDQNNGFGIQVRSDSGTVDNVIIANNTSVRNKGIGSGIVVEDNAVNCQVWNNICVDNGSRGIRGYRSGSQSGSKCVARKNICHSNPVSISNDVNAAYMLDLSGTGNYGSPPGDNITSDPLFTDKAANNFRPKTGSPVFNAGNPDYCPPLDHDLNQRKVASIGAFRAAEEA